MSDARLIERWLPVAEIQLDGVVAGRPEGLWGALASEPIRTPPTPADARIQPAPLLVEFEAGVDWP